MKQLLQKLRSHFGGVSSLILIVYTVLVVAAQALLSPRFSSVYFLGGCLLLAVIFCPILLRFLSGRNACPRQQQAPVWRRILINGCFYLIPLAAFLVYFIACFPGGYSDDSFNQYTQAVQNQYNDWHPVLHTLLAFKLPLTLSGGWSGSVVLLQILCFSGVIGYGCQVIRKYFGTLRAVIAMAWIVLNPVIMLTAMHPWKDVGFAICAMLLTVFALQTLVTKGQWLRHPVCMICFAVVAVLASIFRHNGVLFTAPLVLGVVLCLSKKRALALLVSIVLLFVAVKGPVYMILDAEKPGRRQVETLGVPMAIIGAVASESPELLDAETKEFVYQVAPKEVWEEKYELGNFNSIKYAEQTDNDVIEAYGTAKVLSMTLRCIKASPVQALRSFVALTGKLYALDEANIGFVYPRIGGNDCGLRQIPNMTLIKLCKTYTQAVGKYLPHLFMHLGIQHFILLAFVLAKVKLKQRQGWTKLLMVLGVFCYNFGSGLLLSAQADIFRFFFYTFALMPMLLLILCYNEKERSRPLFVWRKK